MSEPERIAALAAFLRSHAGTCREQAHAHREQAARWRHPTRMDATVRERLEQAEDQQARDATADADRFDEAADLLTALAAQLAQDPVHQRIVQAYDAIPSGRWRCFEAYCLTNSIQTSLQSFVEYLLACADRAESAAPAPPP